MNDDRMKSDANKQLKDHFRRQHDYNEVHVMLLYWEESDNPNFEAEANQLADLFKHEFRYEIHPSPIPSDQSENRLCSAIIDLLLKHDAPGNLLIIHYGGHGDADDDTARSRERLAVWAAHTQGEPTLEWSSIQPRLNKAKAEILLILDCCYSAQAARARDESNRFELFAACAMGLKCPLPGSRSFTTTIIEQIREALKSESSIAVAELNRRLAIRETGYMHTPIHMALQLGKLGRSIRLKPLPLNLQSSGDRQSENDNDFSSSLVLRLSTHSRIDKDVFNQILLWLKADAPRIVSALAVENICHSAATMRAYALDDTLENAGRSGLCLPASAKQDALDQCRELDGFLASTLISTWPNKSKPQSRSVTEESARRFVATLIERVASLKRSIERDIVAACGEARLLEQAIEDPQIQRLGIEDTLTMRQLALYPTKTDLALPLQSQKAISRATPPFEVRKSSTSPKQEQVFVEYKYYHKDDRCTAQMEIAATRIKQLTALLQVKKSQNFQTLNCLECWHESDLNRFCLEFSLPDQGRPRPVTLRDIIQNTRTRYRPSLEERFKLAWQIGQAISKWHSAGWVHQGIASRNIIFFSRPVDSQTTVPCLCEDYSMPYLCGFEHSRRSEGPSNPRSIEDLAYNVYNHPKRQGIPSVSHLKEHDMYSYGVLLLEIGLWQLADELFKKNEEVKPVKIKEKLINNANDRLGHFMGSIYRSATLRCLESHFGILEDDKADSKLLRAFDSLVLQKIAQEQSVPWMNWAQ
ncbi:MAG: hypothetical protein Q9178_005486 [Gyalolechia marmorata]